MRRWKGRACPVFTTLLLVHAAVSITLGSPGFPRSGVNSFAYDALNRPETIAEGGRLTRYGYDLAGRAMLLIAGNGQVTENSYDAAGRLVSGALYRSLAERTEGGTLAEFGWGHDFAGNVTSQTESWPGELSRGPGMRTTAMTYDGAYRLLTETIQEPGGKQTTRTYAYDDANNRTAKTVVVGGVFDPATQAAVEGAGAWTYTYNTANQLTGWEKRDSIAGTQVKSATLTYDANGNRLTQTVTDAVAAVSDPGSQAHSPNDLAPGTTSYTWDSQNRLLGVTMPDGSEHAYSYDYRTRRIGTQELPSALSSTPYAAKHTTITFSGGLSVAEWESTTTNPEPGTTNPPSVEYTRGPDMGGGVGGLLYTTRRDAVPGVPTLRYNLSNGRGDIVAQSDPAAALTWTASYEAHGRRTTETGTNADKQRGNSKDEDPTGLLNEGFRYRDLETGVWLSRDPAGSWMAPTSMRMSSRTRGRLSIQMACNVLQSAQQTDNSSDRQMVRRKYPLGSARQAEGGTAAQLEAALNLGRPEVEWWSEMRMAQPALSGALVTTVCQHEVSIGRRELAEGSPLKN